MCESKGRKRWTIHNRQEYSLLESPTEKYGKEAVSFQLSVYVVIAAWTVFL